MRSNDEMMKMLMDTAKEDSRILAVYMNGSRTNPSAIKDIFQDYDIVYTVTDTAPFIEDKTWIDRFGERLYMQMPEAMDMMMKKACDVENSYGWLMQFKDGNRLDLHVKSIKASIEEVTADSLTKILLDKQHVLPNIPEASESHYYMKKPTKEVYDCTCNEFWWITNNIAKGLWRSDVTYVMDMLNFHLRPCALNMLGWYSGINHGFNHSMGKSGKYLSHYLPTDLWKQYLHTYSSIEIDAMWDSVYTLCDLFDNIARSVGLYLKCPYDDEMANNAMLFLRNAQLLPKDSKTIF